MTTVSCLTFTSSRLTRICLLFMFLGGCFCASGADVRQWRGVGHRGVYRETGLLKTWPEGGPPQIWKASGIGAGYSSPVIADGKIYFTGIGDVDGRKAEFMTCLNSSDGKILWQTAYGNAWSRDYPSARCTPTIDKEALYAISGSGEVACLSLKNGKLLWQINAKKDFGGVNGGWGTAESPLVDERAVYFTPGGQQTTMVALDKSNGQLLWKTKSLQDKTSYVTPTAIKHNNVRQIIGATTNYVFGVNPENGQMVWNVHFANILDQGRTIKRYDILVNSLVYHGGKLFLSNGYNHGSMMFQLDAQANKAEVLWTNLDLCSQHHGFVWLGKYIFGSSHGSRKWCVIDAESGKTAFAEQVRGVGISQVIAADGMIFTYDADRGNVIMLKPATDAFNEIARFTIRDGQNQHWCHPIIADGILYLRRGDVAMAYKIK